MKTKSLFRYALQYAIYSFVFFWTAFSLYAQCPTIPDVTPPPICDAAGYTFADLSADFATDEGGGIVWYDALTGGNDFGSTELVSPGTYYADDSSGSCSSRNSVTVTFEVDPVPIGASLDKFYCSNDNATIQDYIDDTLASFIPSGGNVAVYYDFALTNQANASDALSLGIVNLYSVFQNSSSCTSQIKLGKSIISVAPADPTPSSPQLFCSDSSNTIADLDPGTTSSVSWYNDIDVNGDPVLPVLPLSTILIDGNTYYVQIDDILCDSNTIPVTVTINDPFDPGTSGSTEYCQSSIPTSDIDLISFIGGSPDLNGTWAGPIAPSGSQGTVNISTLTTPGVYTFIYTVPANGACPSNNANVSITINETFTSGTIAASNPAEFCESALPSSFDLFSLLDGEDINGLWTQGTLSSDPAVTSPIDLTGFTPGTYNFTYTHNVAPNPCPEESTTVQIIVNPQPDTGVPTTAIFCENDLAANSPLDLFGQLTGNEPGGTWTDDSSTGALTGSDVDITGLTIGSYNFTYSITSVDGCTNSSTVVLSIVPAPESGVANSPATYCIADITAGQVYNLFDLLEGEDQAGTWSDDDLSGALTGNSVALDALASGTYNFTYDVTPIGSCDDVDVTVSIVINDTPAPTATATQEFCDSAIVSDLTATGTSIQWYDVASGGIALAGDVALVDAQVYYATQTIGCESSNRVAVTAVIYQSPNSGNLSAAPISSCENNNAIDLFNGLDGTQDAGGVWQDTDGTGALTGNIFDATLVSPGTYQFRYYVSASSPCIDVFTDITVTIETPLSAGSDSSLDACTVDSTTDLFSLLGSADIGGTWSPALASGTGVFDPSTDTSGTYTYTISNSCGTDSSDVVVTVTQAPDAGIDNTISICVIDGTIDLFAQLGGTPDSNGVWSPALPSGTGVFDPNSDASGVYTYTVTAVSPCATDAVSQVTVTVNDSSAPVVVNANPAFCLVDNPTVADLDAALNITGTVTWYADASLAIALNATDALVDGEDYFATQTNSTGCESSQNVQVDVTVNDASTPTFIDPNLELCINDNPTIMDLTLNISEYDSNLDNVIWYDSATGGSTISNSTMLANAVTYYASLYDANTGCESSVRSAITPDLSACGKIVLPDGFSPNGDGINDTYSYNNLEIIYPNFEIEIFNRYGNAVYKGNASTPRFDGTSNQSSIGNGKLPVGVYFYVFKFNDNENKPEQGRLYISR